MPMLISVVLEVCIVSYERGHGLVLVLLPTSLPNARYQLSRQTDYQKGAPIAKKLL